MKKIIIVIVGVFFSLTAQALTYAEVMEMFGNVKIIELCTSKCSSELSDNIDYCNAQYPLPYRFTDPNTKQAYANCVGEYLADYYQCVEACPPFEKTIPGPGS